MIVLDGSNICKTQGKGDDFVTEALPIVYEWFASRGHDVVIILPQSRKSKLMGAKRWAEVEILNNYEKANILYYSPSKKTDERSWDCYDDRFIIDFAARNKAIVVSNDYYRDVLKEDNPEFKEQIRDRYFCQLFYHLPFSNFKGIAVPPHPRHVYASGRPSRKERPKSEPSQTKRILEILVADTKDIQRIILEPDRYHLIINHELSSYYVSNIIY